MGTNFNRFGKQRTEEALVQLATIPLTPRQAVKRGLWPSAEIARRVLNKLRKRGRIKRIGDVNLFGNDEFLWYRGNIQHRQHEAEITEIQLGIKAQEVRRLYEVDPEVRMDAVIVSNGVEIPWEHESSEKLNIRQIKEKMDRYGDKLVVWTCMSKTWLDKLTRFATSDKHMFTTFEHAVDDFHGPIWVDRHGNRFSLHLEDQLDVQL